MHRRLLAGITAAATATLALTIPATAAHAEGRYGKNDAGGFRNVLPAGTTGVASAEDFQAYLADGTLPEHWADQQPLYENLLYGAARLTNRQIPKYFKDARFGVKPGDVESRIHPRKGVTIIRDKGYGVPHVYGKTRSDTMFGAGYAGAADRLFLMDVLRHTGRAQLSSFLGGGNISSDESQWLFAPYTERDLRRQITMVAEQRGALGRRASRDVTAYVKGINAYIKKARTDADLMPVEYSLIGKELKRWKRTDVVATASLIGGIFGRGGGNEVTGAEIVRALEKRFGKKHGRRIWSGFRDKNDPSAPVTIKASFPYQSGDSFSPRGLAIPKAGSVQPVQVVSGGSAPTAAAGSHEMSGIGDALRDALANSTSSNWELVTAKGSRNGHPIGVLGPQVGYWVPQVLMEQELHGPGIDAAGASFAGLNLVVQMGHGRDYAWSATSAGSDNVDTFAEVLCGGDRYHYRYQGKCRPMEKLARKNSWTPNVIDDTPAGSATLTAYRTVHGIVTSYGTVKGKRVAFATARSTYFHETESVIGFSQFNNPKFVTSPQQFQKAAANVNFTFNWAYLDSKHTGYFLSGDYPQRAPGTSPDLPVFGSGKYDWRGFDPKRKTADWLPDSAHPQAIDQKVMVSWNNKPAKDWASADDQWGYGPIYRSQMIDRKIKRSLRQGKMTKAQLVQSMALPATQDIRGVKLLPTVFRAVGSPGDARLQDALRKLRAWQQAGSHRRDLNRDGRYEHNAAIQIMDAWWPKLVQAQFQPTLGKAAFESIQDMIGLGALTGGDDNPRPPSFSGGWWGYVDQDLRSLLKGGPVKGGFDRVFCGDGDKSACRRALRSSLLQALDVTPQELYGVGSCESDPQASCWDKNRLRVTAAISMPKPFPFQNRPTFQQVVSVPKSLSGTPRRTGNG